MIWLLQRAAQFRVRGFHQREAFRHGDGLRLLAGLQRKVDANFLANLQNDILAFDSLETLEFGANSICAGKQVGRVVGARIFAWSACESCRAASQGRDCGAADCASGLVGNRSQDAACSALRERSNAGEE